MPVYDYECPICSCLVSIKATIQEKNAGLFVSCPHCGADEMKQVYKTVHTVSGALSASDKLSAALKESESKRSDIKKKCSHTGKCSCHF